MKVVLHVNELIKCDMALNNVKNLKLSNLIQEVCIVLNGDALI